MLSLSFTAIDSGARVGRLFRSMCWSGLRARRWSSLRLIRPALAA